MNKEQYMSSFISTLIYTYAKIPVPTDTTDKEFSQRIVSQAQEAWDKYKSYQN